MTARPRRKRSTSSKAARSPRSRHRTMRAAMYYANDDVRIVDLPKPRIGPGEILVKVRSSGICGSDVMEWYRKPKAPLVLGHEIAAEVVRVGDSADSVKIGDRVFVSHHVPCGSCRYCLAGHETVCETLRTTNFDPGGFAEFVRVPAIDVVEFRKAAALKSGADVVIDGREDVPTRVKEANEGNLADLVITCTGAPKAIAQGLASVDRGGTVLFFAPVEPAAMVDIP